VIKYRKVSIIGGRKMKEFKVVIENGANIDERLEKVLAEYVNKGWNIVSINTYGDYGVGVLVVFSK
jgi:hypothetical protein